MQSSHVDASHTPTPHVHTPHVHALRTKHAGLEARLREEQGRPAPDVSMIRELKKQKLRVKEEIATF